MTVHADVFADALNGTATTLLDDTAELLGVVERLHGLPGTAALSNAGARPDFRSELRARLLEQAAATVVDEPHAKVVPITSRWNQSWARRNRARLLTSAAAGIVIVTAVSIGASNSLPGNPLYPLKRGGESAEYAFAGSDEARGKLELHFARTRLNEISRLTSRDAAFGIAPVAGIQAAGGTTILATSTNTWVVRLFGDMDGNAVKGQALLQKSFQNNPRPAPLREVQEFAMFQEAQLKVLKGRLAGPALTKATSSLIWATTVVKKTTAALTKCSGNTCPIAVGAALSTPGTPPASLAPQPSAVPSAIPSSPGASTPALLPPPSLPPTTPLIEAPPQTTPTPPVAVPPTTPAPPTSAPPSPSDTPSQTPTDVTPTPPSSPSAPPTSATPTPSPTPSTESPSPDPTTLLPVPPTTPAVPSTEPPVTVAPTTEPPTTDPPTTPPATTVPPVVTTPAAPTPDPPTTTPAPPTTTPAPPTTTPAPPTTPVPPTTTPEPTSTSVLICLHGGHLIHGICIRPPGPPGRD